MINAIKFLLGSFFAFCIGVHIYGLIKPFSQETVLSHIVHSASYTLCLFALLKFSNYRLLLFVLGAIYPFFYHARCAYQTFLTHHTLNGICLLVVAIIPLGALWLQFEKNLPQALNKDH